MSSHRRHATPIAPAPFSNGVSPQVIARQSSRAQVHSNEDLVGSVPVTARGIQIVQNDSCEKVVRIVEELQKSHVELLKQLAVLREDVTKAKKLANEADVISRGPSSSTERILRRAILFAKISAVKTLQSTHPEFARLYASLCPGNSVRQIVLKSKQTECTLFDFRVLASHIQKQNNIRSTFTPSEYLILLSSDTFPTSCEISFETFYDLCEALQLPQEHREQAVYRERRNTAREVRSLQVLGTEMRTAPGDGDKTSTASFIGSADIVPCRKVLLARSMLRPGNGNCERVHVMTQASTVWTENGWEEGFAYGIDEQRDLREFSSLFTGQRTFSIAWERLQDSTWPRDVSAELVPGFLRIFFPAVVLRTSKLIISAQEIFRKIPRNAPLAARFSNRVNTP